MAGARRPFVSRGTLTSSVASAPLQVILVDDQDRELGLCEKLQAHREGLLHRAVSVFAFDDAGRLLVQRRALAKYHSGALWSNSACSHPRMGEPVHDAARRALREELGVECDGLRHAFRFTYRADVGHGLIEHEVDHVFVCRAAGTPRPEPSEVSETRWIAIDTLLDQLETRPEDYTVWFRMLMARVAAWMDAGQTGRAGS